MKVFILSLFPLIALAQFESLGSLASVASGLNELDLDDVFEDLLDAGGDDPCDEDRDVFEDCQKQHVLHQEMCKGLSDYFDCLRQSVDDCTEGKTSEQLSDARTRLNEDKKKAEGLCPKAGEEVVVPECLGDSESLVQRCNNLTVTGDDDLDTKCKTALAYIECFEEHAHTSCGQSLSTFVGGGARYVVSLALKDDVTKNKYCAAIAKRKANDNDDDDDDSDDDDDK